MNSSGLLSVSHLSKYFGGVKAVDDVSFEIFPDEVAALIGPNGAGKTTIFNCLSRIYDTDEGQMVFDGVVLSGRPAYKLAQLGIGRTFQNLAVFPSLTVEDTVLVGMHSRTARASSLKHCPCRHEAGRKRFLNRRPTSS